MDINLNQVPEKLIKQPYTEILKWAERILPKTGAKVFSVLALQPCSLILPNFKYIDKDVRSSINTMIFSPSGSGKTTIAKLFRDITYSGFHTKSQTKANIRDELEKYQFVSIIIDDLTDTMKKKGLIKILEGVLEEGEVRDETKRKRANYQIKAIGIFMSIPSDISSSISGGFIERCIPILIFHKEDEQKYIIDYISRFIGNENYKSKITIKDIKSYYLYLKQIQDGKTSIKPVIGYEFLDRQREYLKEWCINTVDEIGWTSIKEQNREIQEGFRVLIASAFLNIFNREVKEIKEGNILIPNDYDLEVAIKIMRKSIYSKYYILELDKIRNKLYENGKLDKKDFLEEKDFDLDYYKKLMS